MPSGKTYKEKEISDFTFQDVHFTIWVYVSQFRWYMNTVYVAWSSPYIVLISEAWLYSEVSCLNKRISRLVCVIHPWKTLSEIQFLVTGNLFSSFHVFVCNYIPGMHDIKAMAFGNELQSQRWFCDFAKCSVNLTDKVMISLKVCLPFSCGYIFTWRFRSQKRLSLTNSPHKSNIQVKLTSWKVRRKTRSWFDNYGGNVLRLLNFTQWEINNKNKKSHKESGIGLGISSAVSLM